MSSVNLIGQTVIYDNPIPTLRSRHGFFPGIAATPGGDLVALYSVGQAFESNDHVIHVSRSTDRGRTWSHQGPLHPQSRRGLGSMKPTLLNDGTFIAIGYSFYRETDEVLTNPATGGLPGGSNLTSFSGDEGRTWSLPQPMALSRPELLEISGPCIQLSSGELLAVGTPMTMWDGTRPSGHQGVLLRSGDRGKTWNDRTIYFAHPTISPLEARLAQMADGRVLALVWAFDEKSGRSLNNHLVVSHDDGRTWSAPVDLGIAGQASNLLPLHGDRLLSVHAEREAEPVGLVVRLVDFAGDRWTNVCELNAWSRAAAMKVTGFADMGANVKFGQPSLLALGDNEFLIYHWAIENGQGRILGHRIHLSE